MQTHARARNVLIRPRLRGMINPIFAA